MLLIFCSEKKTSIDAKNVYNDIPLKIHVKKKPTVRNNTNDLQPFVMV